MATINLRDYYPFYQDDVWIEITDDLAAQLKQWEREESNRQRKRRRYHDYSFSDFQERCMKYECFAPDELYERKPVSYTHLQAQMTQEKLDFFTTREAYRTDDPEHPAFWFVYVWSYDEKVREAASIRHYEAGDIPYMMTVQIDAETGNCLDVKMVWDATLLSLSERFGM